MAPRQGVRCTSLQRGRERAWEFVRLNRADRADSAGRDQESYAGPKYSTLWRDRRATVAVAIRSLLENVPCAAASDLTQRSISGTVNSGRPSLGLTLTTQAAEWRCSPRRH